MDFEDAYNLIVDTFPHKLPKSICDYRVKGLWVASMIPDTYRDFSSPETPPGYLVALDDKSRKFYQFNPMDPRYPDYFEVSKTHTTKLDRDGNKLPITKSK